MRARGCISVRHVVGLGFSDAQAESALKYLASVGRAVRVRVGRVALWCCSEKSAARHVKRLRRALRALICAAKVKYVTPGDVLELVIGDKAARELFSRYVNPSMKDTAALHLISGLLAMMCGEPAFYKRGGSMPVYFAACLRPKKR